MNAYEQFGWDEERYLAANPDVRAAVDHGLVRDGYHHYLLLGRFRDNPGGGFGKEAAPTTKLCLDPWLNAEFTVEGKLKPCCNYFRGEDLPDDRDVTEAHNAPMFRELRHRVLTGDLGAECKRCHIRETVPVIDLIGKLQPFLDEGADLLGGGRLETVLWT